MKQYVLIIFSIMLSTVSYTQLQVSTENNFNETGLSSGKTERLNNLVNEFINKGLPGMVVLVKEKDQVWKTAAGFSNIENKRMMRTSNKLPVASITKMFVAVVTMKLVEERALDLDKPIRLLQCGYRYKKISNADKITIRHLLSHTSGLPDFIKDTRFVTNLLDKPTNIWNRNDLLKFLAHSKPESMPGEKGKYCNSNFLLLADILDNEYGGLQNHIQRIQQSVLQPLQLQGTGYLNRKYPPSEFTAGYADLYRSNQLINLTHLNSCGYGNGFSGMYSTAGDLSEFLNALLIKKTLLKDSILQLMQNCIQDSEEKSVAFGLGIWKDFQDENKNSFAYGHRGREAGYTTDLFWFPRQDISFVIMMNCGIGTDSPVKNLFLEFRKKFVEELLKGSLPPYASAANLKN
jgi:D-alanyl-D-alanine carboxypeptidase